MRSLSILHYRFSAVSNAASRCFQDSLDTSSLKLDLLTCLRALEVRRFSLES